jgi:hypothetical protein
LETPRGINHQILIRIMSWEEPQPPILSFGTGLAVTAITIVVAGLLVFLIWG